MRRAKTIQTAVISLTLWLLMVGAYAQDGASDSATCPEHPNKAFGTPEMVTILGYDDHAMEPFLSRDGGTLFFNNLNQPPVDTNLHYATSIDGTTFEYIGEVEGANSAALDAVATMDAEGNFFFVSLRSYQTTFSTLYMGQFRDGGLSDIDLVAGISPEIPGMVNSDIEVSPDGNTLYFVDGRFEDAGMPESADLVMAVRGKNGFERLANSAELLANVNTDVWEYAAAISEDGRELFFTRYDPDQSPRDGPKIFRAFRSNAEQPFACPQPIGALTGFVEAPTLSPDENALYYHRLDPDTARFVIYRSAR